MDIGHLQIYIDPFFFRENGFDGFVSFVSFFNVVGMHFPVPRMLEMNTHSNAETPNARWKQVTKISMVRKKRAKSFKEERLLKLSIYPRNLQQDPLNGPLDLSI